MRMQGSVELIGERTKASGYTPHEYYDTLDCKVIRIVVIGDSTKVPMLLIHGSPSSLMEWMSFLNDTAFLNHFNLVAIDRPGYGLADFGNLEMDLHKQSKMLHRVMVKARLSKPAYVIGSSYGGSLAACYAMDFPRQTSKLILMYSSLMPGAEKTYPISRAVKYPVIEQMTPMILRMPSFEKFNHYNLLSSLQNWDSIKAPTMLIHGTADSLIYYRNSLYAMSKMRHAPVKLVTLPGFRHAIMFSKPKLMKQLVLKYLEK